MGPRTVVTRKRRQDVTLDKPFQFTHDDIPLLDEPGVKGSMHEFRENAWSFSERLPMPTTKDEPWRRTDIKSMRTGAFKVSGNDDRGLPEIPKSLLQSVVSDAYGGQVVLSPGKISVKLDSNLSDQGVIFTDLLTAERKHAELLENIKGEVVGPEEGKFAALAAALADRGIFLYVPRGVTVDLPLHSVLWGPGTNLAYLSHIIIWIEDGGSVTYVHESASETEVDGQAFHAGIVEAHVGEGANLRFVELQSWGEHVWNFSHERARVKRDGNLDWVFGAMGSHLTKNFSDVNLIGQGASGRMSGFYFTDGYQHLDHDTQQNHLAPNTTSDLLFKGALKDSSRSVWQGMIYVAPGAQKTDGYQANRNLVLSPNARADSIPGLEIMADDVRCTHGATVGKIDADQVFYLRSRGIPYDEAERLIVEGFFDPIMQRIPFEGVRERFQEAIADKLG